MLNLLTKGDLRTKKKAELKAEIRRSSEKVRSATLVIGHKD